MTILSKEVELVRELNEEGLLNHAFADKFLEEIQEDREIIENDRAGVFRRRRGRKQELLQDKGILHEENMQDGMGMSSPLMDDNGD